MTHVILSLMDVYEIVLLVVAVIMAVAVAISILTARMLSIQLPAGVTLVATH